LSNFSQENLMTSLFSPHTGKTARALNTEYYSQRATEGLIVAEAAQISPQGQGYPDTPGIDSKDQIDA
jgi:N-ethylmaleimide reductase